MANGNNIFDKSKKPVGRPRKKEYFKRAYTVTFNEKVVYTLILSNITTGTKYSDRFDTKEQVEWLEKHEGETRKGILLDVYEKVPKNRTCFRDIFDEKRKAGMTRTGLDRVDINRRFIARIKDDKEGYIFYINLWNVEFEKNYMAVIADKMCIPYGWIINRDKIMSNIGKSVEQYVKEIREKNYDNRYERKKEVIKKKIGTSKLAYDREVDILKGSIKEYRKRIMEYDNMLNMLEEYWNDIDEKDRTI